MALDGRGVDRPGTPDYVPRFAVERGLPEGCQTRGFRTMKVITSLKTANVRDKGCRVVRRRGRVYVINKKNPRFKARQG